MRLEPERHAQERVNVLGGACHADVNTQVHLDVVRESVCQAHINIALLGFIESLLGGVPDGQIGLGDFIVCRASAESEHRCQSHA